MASKRSSVWNYFELEDNKKKAKCQLCKMLLSYHSSTSSMKLHLKSKHKREYDLISNESTSATKVMEATLCDQRVDDMFKPKTKYSPSSARNQQLTRKLTEMLALDSEPFRIVEKPGFKAFVNALDPKFQFPGRKRLSKQEITQLYEEKKNELKVKLRETDFIAITMDGWTSRQTKEYLGITAHSYRMSDYKLQSKVLSTQDLCDDPTAVTIGNTLLAVLTEREIVDKISAVVTDGAAVNGASLRHIGLKEKHVYCIGHKLNLVVKESTHDYKEVIDKVRRISTFFHRSPKQTTKLNAQQQSAGKVPLKIIMDVPTRWNSTFYMLKRYIELHQFISAALTLEDKLDMLVTGAELDTLKIVSGALQPFDDVTKIVSGDQYPTVSIVFPVVRELLERTQRLADSSVKTNLLTKMGIHFRDLENNRLYSIATFLDPRFKDLYFTNESTLPRIKAELEQDLRLRRFQPQTEVQQTEPEPSTSAPRDEAMTETPMPDCFFSNLDKMVRERRVTRPTFVDRTLEITRYCQDLPIERKDDPVVHWQNRDYPALKKMALMYLSIPATSVPAERLFSKAGEIVNEHRCRLNPNKVDMLCFLNKNCQ